MNVLIIDDQEESVKGIKDFCEEKSWDVKVINFDNVYEQIVKVNPDIIILDWREDADNMDVGSDILDNIWMNGFRPTVVFSANAPVISIEDKLSKSKLLKLIPKGDEEPVIEYLKKNEKFVTALSDYRTEIGNAMIDVLNAVPVFHKEDYPGDDVVKYILSKRTASFFDVQYGESLAPAWVQYTYPPIVGSLCVCDILRSVSKDKNYSIKGDPAEYKLVLTPSCDMVPGRAKVSHVLCASCFGKEKFHNIPLIAEPKDKNVDKVGNNLNLGYNNQQFNLVALPGFSDVLPYMTADLKVIELVDLSKIALSEDQIDEETEYVRVVTIESPFREQIVWAHMQNSCRPGVPERNTRLWAKEILTL